MPGERDKYVFDVLDLERRCYLLLACFLASRSVHEYCQEAVDHEVATLVIHEPQVIRSYLIDVSIRLRMIDDVMRSHGRVHHLPSDRVGTLEMLDTQIKGGLSIRDACNKIIHAESIRLEQAADTPAGHLAPSITLSGEQNGRPWIAIIHVRPFVKAAAFMARKYDDDWDVSAFRE